MEISRFEYEKSPYCANKVDEWIEGVETIKGEV